MYDPIPETDEYQICDHCGRYQNYWIWRQIEAYPKHLYEKLCVPCAALQVAGFLPDRAIWQAQGIVWFEQAELSGRCVRATDGAE